MSWFNIVNIERRTDETIEKADVTLLSSLIDHLNVHVVHGRAVQIDDRIRDTQIIDGIVLVGDRTFDDVDDLVF